MQYFGIALIVIQKPQQVPARFQTLLSAAFHQYSEKESFVASVEHSRRSGTYHCGDLVNNSPLSINNSPADIGHAVTAKQRV
jgi:hypothetical protein